MLVLGVGGCQRRVETPKTSGRARSRGWWLSERELKPRKRAVVLVLGAVCCQETSESPKTSGCARFRVLVVRKQVKPRKLLVFGAGGCQRGGCQRGVVREGVETLKTSGRARFRGWWLSSKNIPDEEGIALLVASKKNLLEK